MRVDGKCHCGRITYRAEVDPEKVSICHCTDCQVLTGSAYRVTVPAPAASFELLSGEPKIYVKIADSGNERAHGFCDNCGTPIYATSVSDITSYGLRVGALAQRAQLAPKRRIWCRSFLPWSDNIADLPQLERQG